MDVIQNFVRNSERYIYRARGMYLHTGRKSWVTNVWRRSREDAELDARTLAHPVHGDWAGVRVVKMPLNSFYKRYQRIPRF